MLSSMSSYAIYFSCFYTCLIGSKSGDPTGKKMRSMPLTLCVRDSVGKAESVREFNEVDWMILDIELIVEKMLTSCFFRVRLHE